MRLILRPAFSSNRPKRARKFRGPAETNGKLSLREYPTKIQTHPPCDYNSYCVYGIILHFLVLAGMVKIGLQFQAFLENVPCLKPEAHWFTFEFAVKILCFVVSLLAKKCDFLECIKRQGFFCARRTLFTLFTFLEN